MLGRRRERLPPLVVDDAAASGATAGGARSWGHASARPGGTAAAFPGSGGGMGVTMVAHGAGGAASGAGGGIGNGAGAAPGAHGRSARRHVICMVCDFFFPRLGGVEMHIWSQAQCLMSMGHKVIVVTNTHGGRRGIRYMTNGLKVYYTPMVPLIDGDCLPTFYSFFPLFRKILIREGVTIVHGHQATSTLCHECILMARTMGYKAVYTDHSLFGFADAASININKLMKFTLSDVSHAIAVSHTCRENLVLRASLDPHMVSAIPNAVDTTKFTPDPSCRFPTTTINVVMISRLVYRKGIDLAVKVIPQICRKFPNIHFIIGGDGAKKLLLEEMREKHQLHERVELLGAVPHAQVRSVLRRGHVFLNCSLTEAFCIAIVEAASCGLMVVSTRVGGVPEVLRDHMIELAEPNAPALVEALETAIKHVPDVDPFEFHDCVRDMYNWQDVAKRTQVVYDMVAEAPDTPLIDRLRRYFGAGLFFGWVACIIVCFLYLMYLVLEWLTPADTIERCPEFPHADYVEMRDKLHQQHAPIRKGARRRPKRQRRL